MGLKNNKNHDERAQNKKEYPLPEQPLQHPLAHEDQIPPQNPQSLDNPLLTPLSVQKLAREILGDDADLYNISESETLKTLVNNIIISGYINLLKDVLERLRQIIKNGSPREALDASKLVLNNLGSSIKEEDKASIHLQNSGNNDVIEMALRLSKKRGGRQK